MLQKSSIRNDHFDKNSGKIPETIIRYQRRQP